MITLQLFAGLVLLVIGGDSLVRGSVAVARYLGWSPLMIGLTLVGFGTSTPELITSLQAALAGSPGIAIGNVIGSNTANILLILGMSTVICPVVISPTAFRRDGTVLLIATLACVGVVLSGQLDRWMGVIMVLCLAGYVLFTFLTERSTVSASAAVLSGEADLFQPVSRRVGLSAGLAMLGLALTMLGADWLVQGAITLSNSLEISQTVVGLTVVAVGTSLPELITSVVAAVRKQTAIAFGNIIGSNVFNILGILGITATVQPIAVPPEIAGFDIWVMSATTALLLVFALTGWRLTRLEGAVLMAGYFGYVGFLAATA